jgi:hypothetical protein
MTTSSRRGTSPRTPSPRPVAASLAIVVAAMLALASPPAPATAQTEAASSVGGVVIHGLDERPVADVEVVLVAGDGGESTRLLEARSDADGGFLFDSAPTGVEVEVVATFADATYRSGPFLVAEDGNQDLEVVVYETTEDPVDVRISSWVVWVDRDIGVTIQHDLQVENSGQETWLGGAAHEDGTRPVLSVPLHPEAFGLGFLGRFTECCASMRGTEYVHTSPLLPGRTMGTVRYSVETLDELVLTTRLPVESITMMLPEGVGLTGNVLTPTGEIESRGNTYRVFNHEGWQPGETLTLGLTGLHEDRSSPIWFAIAAVVGLLVVALVWHRLSHPAQASDPPLEDDIAGEAAMSPPSQTPVDADLLIEELALLDLAVDRGFITPETHAALRKVRTEELLRQPRPVGGSPWS